MKYSNEDLLKLLKDEYSSTGIIPTHSANRNVHPNVILYRFGSWNNALQQAGIPTRDKTVSSNIEKTCPQCGDTFSTKTYKEATYCSITCSNISRRKIGWKPRQPRTEWLKLKKQESLIFLMDTPFDDLSWDSQRKRIIIEQNGKCNRCGLNEWKGELLTLEIDHKDGDNSNGLRNNLEALCPNCHSLTPTWRGRNKDNRSNVTDEELTEALKSSSNVRQALKLVGLVAKGLNYRRAKRLLQEMLKTCSREEIEQTAIYNSDVMKKILECSNIK